MRQSSLSTRQALAQLHCPEKKLVIIPGATHLFEEPGTLAEVADIAGEWFVSHFTAADHAPSRHAVQTR